MPKSLIALTAPLALAACTMAPVATVETVAIADVTRSDGSAAGSLALLRNGPTLMLTGNLSALPPGAHAFHLHTAGRCDRPDFTTAGGHLNPAGKEHGSLNPRGSHLGDLPNVEVGPDGRAKIDVVISDDSAAALAAIFDADGAAVMVHADPDDYRSDPAGAAGARIACGVLRQIAS